MLIGSALINYSVDDNFLAKSVIEGWWSQFLKRLRQEIQSSMPGCVPSGGTVAMSKLKVCEYSSVTEGTSRLPEGLDSMSNTLAKTVSSIWLGCLNSELKQNTKKKKTYIFFNEIFTFLVYAHMHFQTLGLGPTITLLQVEEWVFLLISFPFLVPRL